MFINIQIKESTDEKMNIGNLNKYLLNYLLIR